MGKRPHKERMRNSAGKGPPRKKEQSASGGKGIKVFVSYSHRDKAWLDRLKVHLTPLERRFDIEVWDDTRLKPGSKWREELGAAVESADIAVLIVSADFLASDFIRTRELPPLLRAEAEEGELILPIIANHSLFADDPDLSQFQAVNDPAKPLVSMSQGDQEEVFVKVARRILGQVRKGQERTDTVAPPGSAVRKEAFLEPTTWARLIRIGSWIFDGSQKRILGEGMHTYLISRKEYGLVSFTIQATLQFSGLQRASWRELLGMNAGILFGWNHDKHNPRYYDILLTGNELLAERIGFEGGEAHRDWDHATEAVPLRIEEGKCYKFALSISRQMVNVSVDGSSRLSFEPGTGVVGRVGLRPWRSQMACTEFVVQESQVAEQSH